MLLHMEVSPLLQSNDGDGATSGDKKNLSIFAGLAVQWSRQVYIELAKELHRKQSLVQRVLDSVDDELLYTEYSNGESTPLKVAQDCRKQWVRGGSDSKARLYLSRLFSSAPGS